MASLSDTTTDQDRSWPQKRSLITKLTMADIAWFLIIMGVLQYLSIEIIQLHLMGM